MMVFEVPYDAFASEEERKHTYFSIKSMLINELKKEGFQIRKGSEIGKGSGNWNTTYIVW